MLRSRPHPRRPVPLTQRILVYLDLLQEPCHYTALAQVLHWPARRVQRACWYLAHTGRLHWCGHGLYRSAPRV